MKNKVNLYNIAAGVCFLLSGIIFYVFRRGIIDWVGVLSVLILFIAGIVSISVGLFPRLKNL